MAREQAESAQRALGQYFVAAEAQRVNTSELEALEAELGTVRAQLAAAEAARDKYHAIAEPPPEKFFAKGHYTADVDLTALQVIAELGVAATAVSPLFKIFGDFFGVTIPSPRWRRACATTPRSSSRAAAVAPPRSRPSCASGSMACR